MGKPYCLEDGWQVTVIPDHSMNIASIQAEIQLHKSKVTLNASPRRRRSTPHALVGTLTNPPLRTPLISRWMPAAFCPAN